MFVFLWGYKPVKDLDEHSTTPALADQRKESREAVGTLPIHNKISRAQAGGGQADAGSRSIPFHLALGHGHRLLPGGDRWRLDPRRESGKAVNDFRTHAVPHAMGGHSHFCHAGPWDLSHDTPGVMPSGLAFTHTGWFYPFFGTFLGWLGVALTGSDTSSNALFGSLQKITAQQLGLDPVLMTAANSAGGVMGKMVDAQSICVATAATNQVGNEGIIFRFVVWHSVALARLWA